MTQESRMLSNKTVNISFCLFILFILPIHLNANDKCSTPTTVQAIKAWNNLPKVDRNLTYTQKISAIKSLGLSDYEDNYLVYLSINPDNPHQALRKLNKQIAHICGTMSNNAVMGYPIQQKPCKTSLAPYMPKEWSWYKNNGIDYSDQIEDAYHACNEYVSEKYYKPAITELNNRIETIETEMAIKEKERRQKLELEKKAELDRVAIIKKEKEILSQRVSQSADTGGGNWKIGTHAVYAYGVTESGEEDVSEVLHAGLDNDCRPFLGLQTTTPNTEWMPAQAVLPGTLSRIKIQVDDNPIISPTSATMWVKNYNFSLSLKQLDNKVITEMLSGEKITFKTKSNNNSSFILGGFAKVFREKFSNCTGTY
jgi:hypothetical protein